MGTHPIFESDFDCLTDSMDFLTNTFESFRRDIKSDIQQDNPFWLKFKRPVLVGFGLFSVSFMMTGRLGRSAGLYIGPVGLMSAVGHLQVDWNRMRAVNATRKRPLTEDEMYKLTARVRIFGSNFGS